MSNSYSDHVIIKSKPRKRKSLISLTNVLKYWSLIQPLPITNKIRMWFNVRLVIFNINADCKNMFWENCFIINSDSIWFYIFQCHICFTMWVSLSGQFFKATNKTTRFIYSQCLDDLIYVWNKQLSVEFLKHLRSVDWFQIINRCRTFLK